jgi:hypothetical protein
MMHRVSSAGFHEVFDNLPVPLVSLRLNQVEGLDLFKREA